MDTAAREELRGLREDAVRHERAYVDANAAWNVKLRELQDARRDNKPPSILNDLQHGVALLSDRASIAQQLMTGSRQRVAYREKVALGELRRQLIKRYQDAAEALAVALADVLEVDRRLERPAPIALGRLFVPGVDPLPTSEPGALVAFQSFLDSPTYRDAIARVTAHFDDYLTPENTDA